jgi:hypothetical protein
LILFPTGRVGGLVHVALPADTFMVSPDVAWLMQDATLVLSAELVQVGLDPLQAAHRLIGHNRINKRRISGMNLSPYRHQFSAYQVRKQHWHMNRGSFQRRHIPC